MSSAGTVLLCIGNTLRRDDGAAHALADLLEARAAAGLHIVRAFQLLPDHAEHLAAAARAVLCDAALPDGRPPHIDTHTPDPNAVSGLHGPGLDALAALALTVYGRCAELFVCSIPCHDFSHGEGLSPEARTNVAAAAVLLGQFLDAENGHA